MVVVLLIVHHLLILFTAWGIILPKGWLLLIEICRYKSLVVLLHVWLLLVELLLTSILRCELRRLSVRALRWLLRINFFNYFFKESFQLFFFAASTTKLLNDWQKLLLNFFNVGDSLSSKPSNQGIKFPFISIFRLIVLFTFN